MATELNSSGVELTGIMINKALFDVIKDYSNKNGLTVDEGLEKLAGVGYTCEKYGGVFKINTPAENEARKKEEEKIEKVDEKTENNESVTDKGENKKPGVKIVYNK